MQSSAHEKKPAISTDSFKQIYAIAKESKVNKEAATKKLSLLLKNACIDEIDNFEFTPAARLASEGDTEAVLFLMKFGASVSTAALGAACGGHFQFAEYLHRFYGAAVHIIAKGAALGGHREYAENLRLKHKLDLNWIAYYAAKGKHKNYVGDLCNVGASTDKIARGAASGGYRDYADSFRNEKNAQAIAECAALVGDFDYVEYLCQQHGLDIDYIAATAAYGGHRDYAEDRRLKHGTYVNFIARGAAMGGHREYAEYLRLNFGANIDEIARRSAVRRNIEYAEYLRLNFKVDVKEMAKGAAVGGHLEYLEHLYREFKLDVKSILNEAVNCNPPNLKLALQALARNDDFRVDYDKVTKQIQVSNPKITKLIQKAQKISSLKDKYNFDQCFALGQPELCVWYLDCFELVRARKITFNLFASVGIYLSPLTYQDSKGLCSNLRFDMFQKLLIKDVNKHCASKRWFGLFGGDDKADAFSVDSTNAKTTEQLKPLLEKEMKQDGNDAKSQPQDNQLRDLATRHYKRFN